MKNMRKLASLLLALVMVFAMATVAFAADGDTGTITITTPNGIASADKVTYKIYKVFDAVTDGTNISYKLMSGKTEAPEGFTVDAAGNVTIDNAADKKLTADQIAAIAAYVANDEPVATVEITGPNASGTATNLPAGYYYITTTVGTAVSITSAKPNASVTDKNTVPTLTKEVLEDANHNGVADTGENWGDQNDANIGDTVLYKTTITLPKNSKTAVMHDKMEAGLSFDDTSVVVKVGDTTLTSADYTLKTSGLSDDCTFEIEFTSTYLGKLTADTTTVVITYSAVLNENAEISTESNDNTSSLTYGEDNKYKTTPDTTQTYSFKFDLVKTDGDKKLLPGAEFELYDSYTSASDEVAESWGNKISLIQDTATGDYRVAKNGETGTTIIVVGDDGKVNIKGLDKGTYYLKETVAPEGYNLLAGATTVDLTNGNKEATFTEGAYTTGGVQVVNQSGQELPTTGGMGTTLFYIVGGILVVAAVVLLVTKKRMTAAE